jgi:phage baseplate assembly protein W
MATIPQPYGITLPIAHGPQGYFNQSYSILEQVKSNLNFLLRTKKGERRMNPEFGSGLWNILFENYTDNITPLIEDVIRKDISRWMSYVNVNSVEVNTDDTEYKDKYKVGVTVLFTVPSVGITDTQTLEISMNTGNI